MYLCAVQPKLYARPNARPVNRSTTKTFAQEHQRTDGPDGQMGPRFKLVTVYDRIFKQESRWLITQLQDTNRHTNNDLQ